MGRLQTQRSGTDGKRSRAGGRDGAQIHRGRQTHSAQPGHKLVGQKYDDGKVQAGVLSEFGLALWAVAVVGTFGIKKYWRGSWKHVPSGDVRYFDAKWRHLLAMGYFPHDTESTILHRAHEAWNTLSTLELELRKLIGGCKDMNDVTKLLIAQGDKS